MKTIRDLAEECRSILGTRKLWCIVIVDTKGVELRETFAVVTFDTNLPPTVVTEANQIWMSRVISRGATPRESWENLIGSFKVRKIKYH